ncbi:PKD domain-containing protein [uncultured Methanolobus sp.]|uniref:PKD domain-containing protein n=1 Tax=uncultured Methanolobus sp. TaxID=218300 RepID=UPI002AAA901D|nr:PKD domain-containing protein [uncultured Methanolobus sp.]
MRNNLLRISGFVIVFAALILSLVSTVSADEVNITFEGHFGGSMHAATVFGNYAYVNQGQDFVVVDMSNPESPSELGRLVTDCIFDKIIVSNSYAYAIDYYNGLVILDISNSSGPSLAGSYNTDGRAYDIAVSNDYAYVADGSNGLVIVDISNPESPTFAGRYDSTAYGVAIADGYAYVADGSNGLVILDVSNPEAPMLVGSYGMESYPYRVEASDGYVYVADGSNGLVILDVSNPETPMLAGSYGMVSYPNSITVSEGYAYIADDDNGLVIIDISNLAIPFLVGNYDTEGYALDVAVSEGYAYVADSSNGLAIIDISNLTAPTLVGSYGMVSYPNSIAVSESYAYIVDQHNGLGIVDISNPSEPILAGSYDIDSWAYDIAVSNDYAYIADGSNGLAIIDISNPSEPTLAGGHDSIALGVAVSEGYAYVADSSNGLAIIDISNPATPFLVGNYDTEGYALDVAVSEGYAYVADSSNGLAIIDISNPATPFLVGNYDTEGYALDVAVSEGYAYVADSSNGLAIIDISNPATPFLVGNYDTEGYALDVVVSEGYAYIADGSNGLVIIDISIPATPFLVGNYYTGGHAQGIAVSDSYAYVADDYNGLVIIDISNPATPTLAGRYGKDGYALCEYALNVAVLDSYVYVADGLNGLIILSTNTTSSPNTLPTATISSILPNPAIEGETVTFEGVGSDSDGSIVSYNWTSNIDGHLSDSANFSTHDLSVGNHTIYFSVQDNDGAWSEVKAAMLIIKKAPMNVTLESRLGGAITTIAISGDYVYYAQGEDLVVMDIRNSSHPSEIGRINTSSLIYDINIVQNYAYVVSSNGLIILDITNPALPTFEGSYAGISRGVAVQGNYAYVANINSLIILDITNPAVPIFTGSYDVYVNNVDVEGDYAYVASDDNGLLILDVSIPSSMKLVGKYDTGDAYDVIIEDDYAYVADMDNGLVIVDITYPASPSFVGSCDTDDWTWNVVISGDYAYMASDGNGLVILNIANPAEPTFVGNYELDLAYSVVIADSYAYVADLYSGLVVLDITNPATPVVTSVYDSIGDALNLVLDDNYVYIADDYNGLVIVNIDEPTKPISESIFNMEGNTEDVAVMDKYAYVIGTHGLTIIDVTDPSSPILKESYHTNGSAQAVYLKGNYAYVADGINGLVIVDVTNPSSPLLVGSYDTAGSANDIEIEGNYAYIADEENGLTIVDISNPTKPILSGICDTGDYAFGVSVEGNYAYVTDFVRGLVIVDVTDKTAPVIVGTYYIGNSPSIGWAEDVCINGDYAYVAWSDGLLIVNIKDPSAPILAGSYSATSVARDVEVLGDYVYLANAFNGLVILHTNIQNDKPTDGSLIRAQGSLEVYVIENDTKHHFTSPEALEWNEYSFDDVINVSSEILDSFPTGDDISISQEIIDKYYELGGSATFGESVGDGELEGEPDSADNYCSYVNFQNGAIECFKNGPHVGETFAILDQFYVKWASMGYGKSVLGYPIGNMSEERMSIKNTPYRYQLFTNGTQLGALEWNLNTNLVYEVHGAIFAKWAEIGFASSVLGLPTGDEQGIPNSKYGTVGRYSTFENGHIHWNKETGVSFVTYGALNECYNKIQGTQSDLGFPIMSQVETTDGHYYCEFEKGCIEWNDYSGNYEPNYNPTINQKIDSRLKAKPNFPQYLLDPNYVGSVTVLSTQLSDFVLRTDLTEQYDQLYDDGIRFYNIRNSYLYNAKQSLKNNDLTCAKNFLERANKMQMCSYNSFQAANDVFVGSTESAETLAEGIRTECELICNIGIGYAPYSSLSILGQSVKAKKAMFVTFACVDTIKEWKINGIGEGAKQGATTVITHYITSQLKYDALGGKTLEQAIQSGSVDLAMNPTLSKQINVEIVDKLMSLGLRRKLIEDEFVGMAIGGADAAAMHFTDDEFAEVVDYYVETTCRMIDVPIETVQAYSPVELRVYDSSGRVTGLVGGVVKNEIPNSIYEPELEKVFICMANDTYRYETVGTANATYGLKILHYENMSNQEIILTDVPATINIKHIYSVDWENEAQINKTVTMNDDFFSPQSISNIQSLIESTWINFTWSNPADSDFNHTEVYFNGIFQTITSVENFNATGLQPDTDYTISTRTVDIYGNLNHTWVNLTAKTKPLDAETLKVDFTANTTCGEAPLTVLFSGNSSNALTWSWDIDGDGNEDGNTKNLIYTYTNPGIYDVSLTVTNAGKITTETKCDYITVYNPSDVILSITDYTEKVLLGSELTYEITMENTKNVELTNVQLVDVLPPELIFVSSSGATFDKTTNTVIFDIGNLMPEESIISKITVKTAAYGPIENSVSMYCDQLEPINCRDITTVVTQEEIAEFPTIIIPVLSVIGFAFIFMRRRE